MVQASSRGSSQLDRPADEEPQDGLDGQPSDWELEQMLNKVVASDGRTALRMYYDIVTKHSTAILYALEERATLVTEAPLPHGERA